MAKKLEHGGGMMSDEDMAALESASGAEAAPLFLEQMIAHHQGAIEMAETELAKQPKRVERTRAGEVDRLESAIEATWKASREDSSIRDQARKAKQAWAEAEAIRW